MRVCWNLSLRACSKPCVEALCAAMALYDDEYVCLDATSVTLKWYYFPTFGDKKIPRESILEVQTLENPGIFETKTWGMAFSDVWWACGWKFNFEAPKKLMIIKTADSIRKGFVCCDSQAFMAAYRRSADR